MTSLCLDEIVRALLDFLAVDCTSDELSNEIGNACRSLGDRWHIHRRGRYASLASDLPRRRCLLRYVAIAERLHDVWSSDPDVESIENGLLSRAFEAQKAKGLEYLIY